MITENKKLLGTILVLITTVGYGLLPSMSQLAYREGVAAGTILFNKYFISGVVIWLYIFIKKVPYKTDFKHFLFISFVAISYIGVSTTFYEAFKYISGSLATIISFTYPAMVVALEMFLGRTKTTSKKLIALGFSMAGLVTILWGTDIDLNIKGVLFALGTAVCFVFYVIGLSEKRTKEMHSMAVVGYVLLYCTVFNFFRCILSDTPLLTTGISQFKYIFILAIVCAFIPILSYAHGVKLIGPSSAAIIDTFEPIVAFIFGYFLVGDVLTINILIGAALIIFAVLVVNFPDKKFLINEELT